MTFPVRMPAPKTGEFIGILRPPLFASGITVPMEKQHILDEIRRTAKTNGGVPLGRPRFFDETGIKDSDWIGKIWVRWSDVVKEAGFAPNKMQGAIGEAEILSSVAGFIRELGHFPVVTELRLRARRGDGFPASNTVLRLGGKGEIAAKLIQFLREKGGFDDILAICEPLIHSVPSGRDVKSVHAVEHGFVYLMRSGKRYKIGATSDIGSRSKAIAVQMPDPIKTVHVIRTDDPFGIESYWHRRFAEKRAGGEWFELSRDDVSAFRRRKTM
jgi:hypothetical protein